VSAILGLHVDRRSRQAKSGFDTGVLTAQVDEVIIEVRGKGGHAARPQHTTDPIATAVMLVSALYQSVPTSRLIDSHGVFCRFHSCGTASNVIPDLVEIAGTLRSTDRRTRDSVLSSIRQICTGIAAATGNTIDVTYRSPLGSVINDVTVMSAIEAATIQVLGGENIVLIDRPSMEGRTLRFIPNTFAEHSFDWAVRAGGRLATAALADLDVEESAIPLGARILARSAMLLAMIGPESSSCR